MKQQSYVLITPAKNEETFIERVIESVVTQTVLPEKWVIVSDRSTDGTDEIVRKYAARYAFIKLVRVHEECHKGFEAKVNAFKTGYAEAGTVPYRFIGNLDADVSFEPTYYDQIIGQLDGNPRLGIAGGIIQELIDNKYVCQDISLNSVAGAVQLFRRECYEEIGGYFPMEYGGIDAAAEIVARASGWEVQTFPEYKVLHHRRVTTGKRSIVGTRFYQGVTNYLLGYSPVFHITRAVYRMRQDPVVIGGAAAITGYLYAWILQKERRSPPGAIRFLRKEQRRRLMTYFINGKRY